MTNTIIDPAVISNLGWTDPGNVGANGNGTIWLSQPSFHFKKLYILRLFRIWLWRCLGVWWNYLSDVWLRIFSQSSIVFNKQLINIAAESLLVFAILIVVIVSIPIIPFTDNEMWAKTKTEPLFSRYQCYQLSSADVPDKPSTLA